MRFSPTAKSVRNAPRLRQKPKRKTEEIVTIQEDLEKAIESAKNALDACKVQGKEGTASSLAVIISELEKVRDHVTETEHYFSLPHEKDRKSTRLNSSHSQIS